MRAEDVDHEDLLDLDVEAGLVHLAGQRAVVIDTVALGLLRRQLIDAFGGHAARRVLTQFGFAHGWRLAEAMHAQWRWDGDDEWRRAVARAQAIAGLFRFELSGAGPLSKDGAVVVDCYEAEQHLFHLGRAPAPVCWTIGGFTGGYLSRIAGHAIYVVEDRCVGRGDATCHLFARTRAGWGAQADGAPLVAPEELAAALEVPLEPLVESLMAAEPTLSRQRRGPARAARTVDEPLGVVAKSPAMADLVELARRVAKVDSTVLLTGESGSGKERIARLVHDESTRAAGPFIAVNCGAITETLLESELFGHARGSFTGAVQDRPGLFEAAHGGTLLLDEVGEVSPGMQVKLLRALQEREIRRVGENRSRRVDVRVVAATNRDLSHRVADGGFRQDLYYRLKVIELHVPALRERREDILPLARVLLGEAARRMKRKIVGLAPGAVDQLLRYEWPGNVRELENAMERAVALARGKRVELDDLPEEVRQAFPKPVASDGAIRPLEEVERDYILAALNVNHGNQTRTAEQLGIGSATLYRKLKSYGLISGRAHAANGQGGRHEPLSSPSRS